MVAMFLAGCSAGQSSSSAGLPVAPPVPAERSIASVAQGVSVATAVGTLGRYHIAPSHVYVAGISSGGFFGVQMHVAHSSVIKGAAIYAGGVFHCAQDSVELALAECGGETVNGQALYHSTLAESQAYLDQQSAAGTIDASSNLQGQPVYLWSGTKDSVVNPLEMADLKSEYAHYGARLVFDNQFGADHGWESPTGEVACGTAASPYMISCDTGGQAYDSEKTWLSLFLGPLRARNGGTLRGTLAHFDQSEFGAAAANSMDTVGSVFVPKPCASGDTCSLVIAFHGCLQGRAQIGDRFALESGIDEWADSNRVVVLYPNAVEAPGPTPYNPNGCWDWWGYDDPNYSLRSGTQMGIVYKMIERLTGRM